MMQPCLERHNLPDHTWLIDDKLEFTRNPLAIGLYDTPLLEKTPPACRSNLDPTIGASHLT
jgi:hypothetical protein